MPKYDVEKDLFAADGVASVSPSWCLAIVGFTTPYSFDRGVISDQVYVGGAVDTSIKFSAEEAAGANPPLIISQECIQILTQTNKETHTSTLSATLIDGGNNFLAKILPGDWILAWMASSHETIAGVISNIKSGKPANQANSGLKFVGRVESVREHGALSVGSGLRQTRVSVHAAGFKEFDTSVFYDPALAQQFDIATWLGKMNIAIKDFISSGYNGGIRAQEAVPKLLSILLGSGIPESVSAPAGNFALQPLTGAKAPNAYLVPLPVSVMLNRDKGSSTYADILDVLIGIQRYSNSDTVSGKDFDPLAFIPDGVAAQAPSIKTMAPVSGLFIPQVPVWANIPFWQVLTQFVNPTINEMYTCLKTNADGDIVPHLIFRQMPFSTQDFIEASSDVVTPFLEIPRWVIGNNVVVGYDIGRSNHRFNFVHCYGQSVTQSPVSVTQSILRAPPIRDNMDIQRNGLFADMTIVNCSIKEATDGPVQWIRIRSDFQMGLHLSLNGTIACKGIQAPICEGDNVEFNGYVYHIESVAHSGAVDGSGRRLFETALAVTRGISANNAPHAIATNVSIFALSNGTDRVGPPLRGTKEGGT